MKAGLIVLPTEVNSREDLVKQIQAKIRMRSPQEHRFEELRNEGFDSETAADLAGWKPSTTDYVEASLRTAGSYESVEDQLKYSTAIQTTRAVQSIGTAAGTAVGTAMSAGLLRLAAQHGAALTIGGIAAGGLVIGVIGAKLVAASAGKVAAAVFLLNIACATGIFAVAIGRRR